MSDSDNTPQGKGGSTAHVAPLGDDELTGVQDVVDLARKFSGYVPTSFRIMARKPALLRAFSSLAFTIMREPDEAPAELKWLVAHAVSASAGSRYFQAHTAANTAKAGLPAAKIQALMEYETDATYSPSE